MGTDYMVHVGPYAMVLADGEHYWDFYDEMESVLSWASRRAHPEDPSREVYCFMTNSSEVPGYTVDPVYDYDEWVCDPTGETIKADLAAFKEKAGQALEVLRKEFGVVEVRWGVFTYCI